MEDKYTLEEFGQLIKDKYPEYADIDNVTLAQKMLEKYPEYSEQVTMDVVEEPVKKKEETQPVEQPLESPSEQASTVSTSDTTPQAELPSGDSVSPEPEPVGMDAVRESLRELPTPAEPEKIRSAREIREEIVSTLSDNTLTSSSRFQTLEYLQDEYSKLVPEATGMDAQQFALSMFDKSIEESRQEQLGPIMELNDIELANRIAEEEEVELGKKAYQMMHDTMGVPEDVLTPIFATASNLISGALGMLGNVAAFGEEADRSMGFIDEDGVGMDEYLSSYARRIQKFTEGMSAARAEDWNINPDNVSKGIFGNLGEGNYEDAAKLLGAGVSDVVPQLVGTAALVAETGGMAVPALVFGVQGMGNTAAEYQARPEVGLAERTTVATLFGAFEGGMEYLLPGAEKLGAAVLGDFGKALLKGGLKEGAENVSKRAGVEFLKGAASESLEEMGTSLGQQLTTIASEWGSGRKTYQQAIDDHWNPAEIGDAGILGALGTGPMAVPYVLAKGVSAIGSVASLRDKVRIRTKMEDLRKQLANAKNPEEKNRIQAEMTQLTDAANRLSERDFEFYSSMDEADQKEVMSLNQKITRLRQRAMALKKSRLPLEARKAAATAIQEELDPLLQKKVGIENKYESSLAGYDVDVTGARIAQLEADRIAAEVADMDPLSSYQREDASGRTRDTETSKYAKKGTMRLTADNAEGVIAKMLGKVKSTRYATAEQIHRGLRNTLKAVETLLQKDPNAHVVLVESREEWSRETKGAKLSRGLYKGADGKIVMYAPAMVGTTAYHEVFHALTANEYGDEATSALAKALRRGASRAVVVGMAPFMKTYEGKGKETQDDEFLTELMARITAGDYTVEFERGILTAFKDFLSKALKPLGIDYVPTATMKDLAKAIEDFTGKFAAGERVDVQLLPGAVMASLDKPTQRVVKDREQFISRVAFGNLDGKDNIIENVKASYQRAKEMLAKDESKSRIATATGWFFGADKKWRYNIGASWAVEDTNWRQFIKDIEHGVVLERSGEGLNSWKTMNKLSFEYVPERKAFVGKYTASVPGKDGGVRGRPSMEEREVLIKWNIPAVDITEMYPTFKDLGFALDLTTDKNFGNGYFSSASKGAIMDEIVVYANIDKQVRDLSKVGSGWDVDKVLSSNILSTLAHEVQHFIQDQEDLARGLNMSWDSQSAALVAYYEGIERGDYDMPPQGTNSHRFYLIGKGVKMGVEVGMDVATAFGYMDGMRLEMRQEVTSNVVISGITRFLEDKYSSLLHERRTTRAIGGMLTTTEEEQKNATVVAFKVGDDVIELRHSEESVWAQAARDNYQPIGVALKYTAENLAEQGGDSFEKLFGSIYINGVKQDVPAMAEMRRRWDAVDKRDSQEIRFAIGHLAADFRDGAPDLMYMLEDWAKEFKASAKDGAVPKLFVEKVENMDIDRIVEHMLYYFMNDLRKSVKEGIQLAINGGRFTGDFKIYKSAVGESMARAAGEQQSQETTGQQPTIGPILALEDVWEPDQHAFMHKDMQEAMYRAATAEAGALDRAQHLDQAYRAGNLIDKAEFKGMMKGRSTGHFGTGFYFFGDKKSAVDYNAGERMLSSIRLRDYNLAPASMELHEKLKSINNSKEGMNAAFVGEVYKFYGFEIQDVASILGDKITDEEARELASRATQIMESQKELNPREMDSVSTIIMKVLGYEGVNAVGTDLDNYKYGTVVYNIRKDSVVDKFQYIDDEIAADLEGMKAGKMSIYQYQDKYMEFLHKAMRHFRVTQAPEGASQEVADFMNDNMYYWGMGYAQYSERVENAGDMLREFQELAPSQRGSNQYIEEKIFKLRKYIIDSSRTDDRYAKQDYRGYMVPVTDLELPYEGYTPNYSRDFRSPRQLMDAYLENMKALKNSEYVKGMAANEKKGLNRLLDLIESVVKQDDVETIEEKLDLWEDSYGELVGKDKAQELEQPDPGFQKLMEEVKSNVNPGGLISKGKGMANQAPFSVKHLREASPVTYIKNASVLSKYPLVAGVKKFRIPAITKKSEVTPSLLKRADEVYRIFVQQVTDNLLFLHDAYEKDLRTITRLWYDGANKAAQDLASKHGVSIERVAAIIAALSPQKDWNMNLKLASLVLEVVRPVEGDARPRVMTREMVEKLVEIAERGITKDVQKDSAKLKKKVDSIAALKELAESYVGMRMEFIPDSFLPQFTRAWAEVHADMTYYIAAPDGTMTEKAVNSEGNEINAGWGSYTEIGKAISILNAAPVTGQSDAAAAIQAATDFLGEYHKIRNFFNNISAPGAIDGSVTIDTHAVAAGLLLPLASADTEVMHNFGGSGVSSSKEAGYKGVYFAYAEAYAAAASQRELLPREMQSITWEAVRTLFEAKFKTSKNKKLIRGIFEKYEKGEITLDEARAEIVDVAGGIKRPAWAGQFLPDADVDAEAQPYDAGVPGQPGDAVGAATDGGARDDGEGVVRQELKDREQEPLAALEKLIENQRARDEGRPVDATYEPPYRNRFQRTADMVKEVLYDSYFPIMQVQKSLEAAAGLSFNDGENFRRALTLMQGKAAEDIAKSEEFMKKLAKMMAEEKISQKMLSDFLYAKHAPERNYRFRLINQAKLDKENELLDKLQAKLKKAKTREEKTKIRERIARKRTTIAELEYAVKKVGSGMSDEQAEEILASFSPEVTYVLEQMHRELMAFQKETREMLVEFGLNTEAEIDAMEFMYPNYVPLAGWAEDEKNLDGGLLNFTGSGMLTGVRRAVGRSTKAADPLAQIFEKRATVAMAARKNEALGKLHAMLSVNKNPSMWKIYKDGEGPQRPTARGRMSTSDMRNDPHFVEVMIGGKSEFIRFESIALANSVTGANIAEVPELVRGIGKLNRYLSQTLTTLNPSFVIANFSRDILTAYFNLLAEKDIYLGKSEGKNLANAMLLGVNSAMKAVYAAEQRNGKSGTKYDKYWQEFKEDGAKTDWPYGRDAELIREDLDNMLAIARGEKKGKNAAQSALRFVENMNLAVENATRLSAYVAARESGLSREQAAEIAKELTVNFNRSGTYGPFANSLFLFFNASVQGTAAFGRALFNAKTEINEDGTVTKGLNGAQKLAIGMVMFGAMLSMYNVGVSDDDEDGESFYSKIPDYEKERNLIIMNPLNGKDYFKLPLPYGYNIFHNIGSAMADVSLGVRNVGDGAGFMISSAFNSFVPISFGQSSSGVKQLVKTGTPTFARPWVEWAINENYFGAPVHREAFPGQSIAESELAHHSPEWLQQVAQFMNEAAGGDEYIGSWADWNPDGLWNVFMSYIGGTGKFIARTTETMGAFFDLASGEPLDIEARKMPGIRLVYGQPMKFLDVNKFYERQGEIKAIKASRDNAPAEARGDEKYVGVQRLYDRATYINKRLRELRDLEVKYRDLTNVSERTKRMNDIEKEKYSLIASYNKLYNELRKKKD